MARGMQPATILQVEFTLPTADASTLTFAFMKTLFLYFPLILALACCKKKEPTDAAISPGNYTGPNELLGIGRIGSTAYHCTVDPKKVALTGAWNFGADEPPLGPNKAMTIAKKAIEEKFPEIKTFKSDVITLERFKEGAVYQAIFTSTAERSIGDRSDMTNFMYIYVYMDGTTETPVPAPEAK